MTMIENIYTSILRKLLLDFRDRKLTTQDLKNGYKGPSLQEIWMGFIGLDPVFRVDFDLAIKDLEKDQFIKTGPMEPIKSPPNAPFPIIGNISKREYFYLTEKGYKAAQGGKFSEGHKESQAPRVNISNSNFHQSPIGVGSEVKQTMTVNVESDTEAIERLVKLLEEEKGRAVSQETRQDVTQLVAFSGEGDVQSAKPLFRKLFGIATDGVGQIAWGVISAIIAKQIGM